MTYIVEIPKIAESKELIKHLKTLKYVRFKKNEMKVWSEKEMIKAIRESEKSGRIKWSDAKKEIAAWKLEK